MGVIKKFFCHSCYEKKITPWQQQPFKCAECGEDVYEAGVLTFLKCDICGKEIQVYEGYPHVIDIQLGISMAHIQPHYEVCSPECAEIAVQRIKEALNHE